MARILTYHKIGSHFEFGVSTIRPGVFRRQIRALADLGLRSVPATEAVSKPAVDVFSLTFDDGYACAYEVAAPVMLEVGFRGTIFPVVGAIGGTNRWDVRLSFRSIRHLGWAELLELSEAGFEVGSHGMTHCDLTRLDRDRLRWELCTSKAMLEDRLGRRVEAIAYPFGKCSDLVIREAIDAGYRFGFLSTYGASSDAMCQGRLSVYSIDTIRSIRSKLGIDRGQRIEILKCHLIAFLSRGTPLVKRSARLVP